MELSELGLTQDACVVPPSDVSYEDLNVLLRHLKWMIVSSSLQNRVKDLLMSKLEMIDGLVDAAYEAGNLGRFNKLVELLYDIRNKLCEESTLSDSISEVIPKRVEYFIDILESGGKTLCAKLKAYKKGAPESKFQHSSRI